MPRAPAHRRWRDLAADRAHGLRLTLRGLRGRPGLVVIAIVSLGIGIGVTGTAFSFIDAVRWRALPYPDANRLITISESRPNVPAKYWLVVRASTYSGWRTGLRTVADLGGYAPATNWAANLVVNNEPFMSQGMAVSANLLPMLGATPLLGRLFAPADDRLDALPVMMLSHRLWQTRFGGDRSVVGTSIRLDSTAVTIIGVLPASFRFPGGAEFLVPLAPVIEQTARRIASGAAPPQLDRIQIIARLAPDATLAAVAAETGSRVSPEPQDPRPRVLVTTLRERFLVNWASYDLLLGAVALAVLLIACTNLAGLLLVHQIQRSRELAVRAALGAAPNTLVRQLLTEGVVLATAGGLVGIGLATGITSTLQASGLWLGELPGPIHARMDPRVIGFTVLLTLVTGALVSLVPARLAARPDLHDQLRDGAANASTGIPRRRLQRLFVIAQLAGAVTLLAGAGVMARSYAKVSRLDIGYDYQRILSLYVVPPPSRQAPAPLAQFERSVIERAAAVPGVEAVGTEEYLNLPTEANTSGVVTVERAGQVRTEPAAQLRGSAVDAGYFATLGIPVLRGRPFLPTEEPAQPVIILNSAAADRWWPGENPVGQRIKLGTQSDTTSWLTVVGVVGKGRYTRMVFARDDELYAFRPMARTSSTGMFILARSSASEPTLLIGPIRAALRQLVPSQPIEIFSVAASLAADLAPLRTNVIGILSVAGCGLLLAAIGLFAVMAYVVGRRTAEIGIRAALGAGSRRILTLVLREALLLTVVGLAVGVVLALGLNRFIRSAIMGVEPASTADLWVLGAVTGLLVLVTLVASAIPARRALAVDPVIALRSN